MATLLFWLGAPATFVWAVRTLRSRPIALQGIAKLVIGTFIFVLAMQEEPPGALRFGSSSLDTHPSRHLRRCWGW